MSSTNYRFIATGIMAFAISVQVAAQVQVQVPGTGPVTVQAGAESPPLNELRELANVFALIKSDYVSSRDSGKLIEAAIAGMVSSLDPHSSYLDKEAFAEQFEDISGKFFGVGIEAVAVNGVIRVITAREGSPAALAGIKPRDVVVRVNGDSIHGLSIDQVGRRMRGEIDTPVTLAVSRNGNDMPLTFRMIRKQVLTQSVKGKLVAPGLAWIRIAEFQQRTVGDFVQQFQALQAKDPQLKGLILDLRNNPGGLVSSAVGISAAFLPKGALVVATRGRAPASSGVMHASPEYYAMNNETDPLATLPALAKTIPMVVLVNAGSASAAEIVSGALQDHKRVTVMGARTFGKGSVQELRRISNDTAVKITIARYYTPAGRSIQATGITPDLAVGENQSDYLREADLENHLSGDPGPKPMPAVPAIVKPDATITSGERPASIDPTPPPEPGSSGDFQLAQAIRYLQGLPLVPKKPVEPTPDAGLPR